MSCNCKKKVNQKYANEPVTKEVGATVKAIKNIFLFLICFLLFLVVLPFFVCYMLYCFVFKKPLFIDVGIMKALKKRKNEQ